MNELDSNEGNPTPSGSTPAASATREESGGTVPPGSDFAKPEGGRAPPFKSSNGATNSTSSVNPPGESASPVRIPKDATHPKAVHPAELPD